MLMYFLDRESRLDSQLLHSTVQGLVSDSEQIPDFSSPQAQEVALPDAQLRQTQSAASSIWYKLSLPAFLQAGELWSVFLPSISGNVGLYVNGALVGESAPMHPPYAQFETPQYFEFPSSLLHSGTNTIHLRVVSERHGSWLPPFYVGSAATLKPAYTHAHWLQVKLLTQLMSALIVLAFLLLGLFWIRPRDTLYGWFAAAILCWAIHIWLMLEPRILIPVKGLWFSFPSITLGWFTIFSARFVMRLPGCTGHSAVERLFLAFGIVGTPIIVVHTTLVPELPWTRTYLWLPGLLLISTYLVWRLLRAALRNPTFDVKLWLLAAVLITVVGLRDYLWDREILQVGNFHYLPYTASLMLIALSLSLLSRVSIALAQSETLNRELEDRVTAKREELAKSYARLQGLERQRTLNAERERMTADMHDGIGGQLVHALAVIGNNPDFKPLEPILLAALDDLRLIIDSADPMEGDLLVVLSNFRARNERRVQAGGLRFLWQVTDLPVMADFGPHKILQVLRILQEALTNVLKHAKATQVAVSTAAQTDAHGRITVLVDVSDNGGGSTQGDVPGRGVNNMHRRAQELGGSVEFSSTPSGSRVRLILPVN
jgi:signal transduction histidine kinase